MKWGKKVCFCLWVMCLLLGGNGVGRAADWVLTPSIETRAEFLNNILYSAFPKKSDYILSAVPNLDFTYNTEVTQLGGSLRLSGLHYIQNPNLDAINQSYNITGNTMATSRLRLNLGLAYLSTNNSQEAVNTLNLLTIRQRTNNISVSPGLTYFLTEKLSTDLTYNFYNVDYQSNPFNNYMTHIINSRLNYLYNEKLTFIISMTASYSQYQNIDSTLMSLGPQVGFNYKINEKSEITVLGGASYSQNESSFGTVGFNNFFGFLTVPEGQKQRSSFVNPFVSISGKYLWENGGASLTFTSSQSASAYLNQSQYNYFNLAINQNITERLRFSVNPYFNTSNTQGGSSNYSQNYIGINPQLTYNLTERTSVGANYNLSYVKNTGLQSSGYNINGVYLFLNYSYPIHFQR
jgi:hypothetical protein